jgi:hypothetical protein
MKTMTLLSAALIIASTILYFLKPTRRASSEQSSMAQRELARP